MNINIFKFSENEDGTAKFDSHTGPINFELMEVDCNPSSYIDDMVVYLFVDVFSEDWDVDSAFEKFEELEYDNAWFLERLLEAGIKVEFNGEEYTGAQVDN